MNNPQVTVWFDGDCPLCLKEIALMRKLDRRDRIEFVDATSDEVACPVSREDLLARFHAKEEGQLHSGAAAFAAMWRAIPLLRPLGIVARVPPVLWILEKLYLVFLRVRPGLQRLVAS